MYSTLYLVAENIPTAGVSPIIYRKLFIAVFIIALLLVLRGYTSGEPLKKG